MRSVYIKTTVSKHLWGLEQRQCHALSVSLRLLLVIRLIILRGERLRNSNHMGVTVFLESNAMGCQSRLVA